MRTERIFIFFFTMVFFFGCVLSGTDVKAQQNKDVKVGLVLSGGGAKGIAHIGVLRALEEAGIRPDYIAGTSMGSVVGGLYSLGYSADQIEEVIRSIDWNQILSNNVPLTDISFEEKEYYGRYLLEFPIQGTSIVLPSGLIQGQMLSELLHYYTWPAFKYPDFDNYPIVFRCVGTNVANGKAVVFDHGALQTAIRASMALPTAFTAVDVDSMLVVDGGVVDNFPTDILRKLGADIIIGVDVSYIMDAPVPSSMIGILMNLAMLQSDGSMPEKIKDCDIYIHPDLTGYSTGSFGKSEEILEVGNKTGQLFKAQFDSLAQQIGVRNTDLKLIGDTAESVIIDNITLKGNKLFGDKLIKSKLGIDIGDTVDRDVVREGMRRVYGINGFQQTGYELKNNGNNHVGLDVLMKEKLPTILSVSVHVDNEFSTGLLLNVTSRDLIGKESRLVLITDISSDPKFRVDYYKYAGGRKNYAFNVRYNFINAEIPTYEKGETVDISTNQNQDIQLNVLTTQSLKQSFMLGTFYSWESKSSNFGNIITKDIGKVKVNTFGFRGSYTRNSLNDRNFPTSGVEFTAIGELRVNTNFSVDYSNENSEFVSNETDTLAKAELNQLISSMQPGIYADINIASRKYYHISNRSQIVLGVNVGLTLANNQYSDNPFGIDSLAIRYDDFIVGGYQRVNQSDTRAYGYNYYELSPTNFGLLGLQYQHVLFGNLFLRAGANVISNYEFVPLNGLDQFSISKLFQDGTSLGYGIGGTLRTRIGPLSAGISRNTSDSFLRYYFSYGFSFNYSD